MTSGSVRKYSMCLPEFLKFVREYRGEASLLAVQASIEEDRQWARKLRQSMRKLGYIPRGREGSKSELGAPVGTVAKESYHGTGLHRRGPWEPFRGVLGLTR